MTLQAERRRLWNSTNFKYLILVFVLGLQCIYWGLSTRPIYRITEIRVAETAREMLDTGEWIVPHFNGEIRLRKPPLAYWLTAASYRAFNEVSEFTARFASAGFALLGAILLFFWIQRTVNVDAALATALCFLSSYIALRYHRSAETDAILLFFVTASCALVYRLLFVRASVPIIVALHLCMGLGFLTKGPPALAMPLSALLLGSIVNRQHRILLNLAHPIGLAVLFLSAFAWYGVIFLKIPDLATYWVGEEIDATYFGGRRPNPIYWYVPRLFSFFAPWSIFIAPAAIWLYRTRPQPPIVQFALIWFATTFIILSVNESKQTQYALLLNPPLAILLGYYLAGARGNYARINHALVFALLGCAAVALVVYGREKYALDAGTATLLLAAAFAPLIVGRLLRIGDRQRIPEFILAGVMAALWIYGQSQLYGGASDEARVKTLALAAKQYEPVYMYGAPNAYLSFYAGRVVKTLLNEADIDIARKQEKNNLYVVTENGATPQVLAQRGARTVLETDGFILLELSKKEPHISRQDAFGCREHILDEHE